MREIKFRGKSKQTDKWIYGNLIVKKTKLSVSELDKELFKVKYSIQQENKTAIEVKEDTIAQLIGINSYGEIYEYMKLYDEYAEEECYLYYDEDDFCYREVYDNISERIDSLEGFIPLEVEN